jgi:hypothetical protein
MCVLRPIDHYEEGEEKERERERKREREKEEKEEEEEYTACTIGSKIFDPGSL